MSTLAFNQSLPLSLDAATESVSEAYLKNPELLLLALRELA